MVCLAERIGRAAAGTAFPGKIPLETRRATSGECPDGTTRPQRWFSNSSLVMAGVLSRLRLRHDMDSPILLPASLVMVGADLAFLSIADHRHLIRRNAYLDEVIFRGPRACI